MSIMRCTSSSFTQFMYYEHSSMSLSTLTNLPKCWWGWRGSSMLNCICLTDCYSSSRESHPLASVSIRHSGTYKDMQADHSYTHKKNVIKSLKCNTWFMKLFPYCMVSLHLSVCRYSASTHIPGHNCPCKGDVCAD